MADAQSDPNIPDFGPDPNAFFAPRPGESAPVQPPEPTPGGPDWSLGGVASRYGSAFGRGAAYAAPVAAGTLALGAATGPGILAAVPSAVGEEVIGGLGGVAEQGVDDIRQATGAAIPSWVGPAVGAGIGFTSAGARLAGQGLRAAGTAIAGGLGGLTLGGHGAIPEIVRMATGSALAETILHGGLMAHLGSLTPAALGAATAYGLYSAARGIGRIAEGTWDAVSRPIAGYMGTGDYISRAQQGAAALTNALSGGSSAQPAPSPANNLGGLLFGIPPGPAPADPWSAGVAPATDPWTGASNNALLPSPSRFYPPPR